VTTTAPTRAPVTTRSVEVDGKTWPALVAHLAEHGIRLVQVPSSPGQMPRYRATAAPNDAAAAAGVTPQQLLVLLRMAQGMTNAAIGRELFLSEDTIKTHARSLFRNLGVQTRGAAVALGYQLGILGGPA
jgi:DNA-binding NarL/FixJ family response regulator